MYRLTVVAIPGCEVCSMLIKKLEEAGIIYKHVDANTHESLCDMLEALLMTNSYPIVTFETPQRAYFLCMPNNADRLGWKVLDDTSTSIGFLTADEIFDQIYKFVKL